MKEINKMERINSEVKNKYKRFWGNKYYKVYSNNEIDKIADEMFEWFKKDENNFWLKDFAIEKKIPRQYISLFAKKSDYFNWIYSLCKDIQESRVIKMGLNKKNNPAIAIMILKNNHHWTDR